MKKIIFSCFLSLFLISAASAQYGTERTGYDGDYFSLEGAIELFRESNSLRDFERNINRRDNWVNNLDLDYDGRVDYIRVEHRRQGNFHAIILQTHVSRYDIQDVAVIEIEKVGSRDAVLQIVGDEDLYGEEVIVEPYEEVGYSSSRGGRSSEYDVRRDYVNVYYWPVVQDILRPDYQVYASPYRWQYYPAWWNAWSPYSWYDYHPRIVVYRNRCRVVNIHRVVQVHNFYRPHRVYSPIIVQRTNVIRVNHGKAPIHRAGVRNDNNQVDRNQVQQPRRNGTAPANTTRTTTTSPNATRTKTTRPDATRTPATRPDVSRNATTRPKTTRTTTTRQSTTRTTTTRPSTTRTTTTRPDVSRTPATRPDVSRNATTRPKTTRTTTTRQSTTRTTTTRPSTTRSTPPRPSTTRSATPRPSTKSTPSQAQRPSPSRKSAAPSSSRSATRSTPVKKSGSTSRKGGGG